MVIFMENNVLKYILFLLIMIVIIPVAAMRCIEPDKTKWEKEEEIQSDINSWFTVVVCDEKGSFEYEPESLVICMTEAVVPYDFISDETDEAVINEFNRRLELVSE